jgi:hypothetical protein
MMTQLDHYVQSCLPETYTPLGVKLLPYSIGHYQLMRRYKCSFTADKETVIDPATIIPDLLLGIAICSRTYDEFCEFEKNDVEWCLNTSWFSRWRLKTTLYGRHLRKSYKTITILGLFMSFFEFLSKDSDFDTWMNKWSTYVKKQIKTDKDFNFLIETVKFEKYMRDSIMVPKVFNEDDDGEGKVSGAHWTTSVLHVLMSEFGYSHTDALDVPISQALALYYKHLEKSGQIEFMSDYDLEYLSAAQPQKS